MEHIDVILGHNVEYRASMSRLPMLVLARVLKRKTTRDGGMSNRIENWHFQGGKC